MLSFATRVAQKWFFRFFEILNVKGARNRSENLTNRKLTDSAKVVPLFPSPGLKTRKVNSSFSASYTYFFFTAVRLLCLLLDLDLFDLVLGRGWRKV